jgi:hypothetical protein
LLFFEIVFGFVNDVRFIPRREEHYVR